LITFCRLRPVRSVTPARAETCRREGTTTLEAAAPGETERAAILGAGLLPVGGPQAVGVAAWVAAPSGAVSLAAAGIPGWRLTVLDRGGGPVVREALARTRAAYLRTGRSRVASAGLAARSAGAAVSVFVDTVSQAVAAVEAGATDLLLRDWDTERLGELRTALAGHLLVERGALPPGVAYDRAAASLAGPLLKAYLDQIDASGVVRPRVPWAPGRSTAIPPPAGRLSAAWADPAWAAGEPGEASMRPGLARVLERSLAGRRPGAAEVELLLGARGAEVEAVAAAADELRRRAKGQTVTYVVNRNINFTNRCTYRCGFCAFSQGGGRGEEPYLMAVEEVGRQAGEAAAAGATEICLQGGVPRAVTGDFYLALTAAVKAAAPSLHLHAFSPLEVWHGARTLGMSIPDFLRRLGAEGLDSLPGTAAEVLDDEVRRVLCPSKIDTARWVEVVAAAHRLGMPTTATIMFGHVDSPASWARHLEVIRRLQAQTGGFTEFVPLPFVHMEAPLYREGRARPGPTWDEVVLLHAVARLALDGLVGNIQASWVKLGWDGAAALLQAGVNDLGGTLMGDRISRAAGAAHGTAAAPDDLERIIRAAGRVPARRTTLYEEPAEAPAPPRAG